MKSAMLFTIGLTLCLTTVFGQSYRGHSNGEKVMHPNKNSQTGMVTGYIPLPSDWKISGDTWYGPGNTKVELRMGGSWTGQQRQIQSIDQIIQQDIIPYLQQSGVQVNNLVNLPTVANNNQKLYAQFWKAAPSRDYHDAKG